MTALIGCQLGYSFWAKDVPSVRAEVHQRARRDQLDRACGLRGSLASIAKATGYHRTTITECIKAGGPLGQRAPAASGWC